MTQEQYDRAVAINKRITALRETLDNIKNTSTHRLCYAYKCVSSDYMICPTHVIDSISKILDKHDIAIRKEIADEINRLTKEIEQL